MTELSLHILDIVQNSIRAKASLVEIEIVENPEMDEYCITISDNGSGMEAETLTKVEDPFFTSRTTRKVGLGIPLIKQNAEQTGGSFNINSQPGEGTRITASFGLNHLDRPILGDIAGSLLILMTNEQQTEICYRHQTPNGKFEFDSREVKTILEDAPINTPEIRKFLLEMIRGNLEQIQISE